MQRIVGSAEAGVSYKELRKVNKVIRKGDSRFKPARLE
jgi:hypothetical protein